MTIDNGIPPENPAGEQESAGPQPSGVPEHEKVVHQGQPMAMEQGAANYDPDALSPGEAGTTTPRKTCAEPYCNQAVGHTTRHGVVNR